MKKMEIVLYDIIKGYSRTTDDVVVYQNDDDKNRIIMGYIKKYGYSNVVVEDDKVIILRIRV